MIVKSQQNRIELVTRPGLNQESSASNGPFYVTNILDVNHPSVKDATSPEQTIGGGGVSIYYSQVLQCLFFSYLKGGKSFMAPLTSMAEELKTVFPIGVPAPPPRTSRSTPSPTINGSNKSAGNGSTPSSSANQPLCQWGEIRGHPGLVTAFYQVSNNPVILMVRPDQVQVQEIKIQSKAKIIDMVAIRHSPTSRSGH